MKLKAGAADVDAETAKVRADFALRAGQPKKESVQKGKKGASNSRMFDSSILFVPQYDTVCTIYILPTISFRCLVILAYILTMGRLNLQSVYE